MATVQKGTDPHKMPIVSTTRPSDTDTLYDRSRPEDPKCEQVCLGLQGGVVGYKVVVSVSGGGVSRRVCLQRGRHTSAEGCR